MLNQGSTYADALKKHPKAFTELYANMVAAGESGGILDTILNRLAAYIEKAMKLKKKVKGAMVLSYRCLINSDNMHCCNHDFCCPYFFPKCLPRWAEHFHSDLLVIKLSNFLAGIGGC